MKETFEVMKEFVLKTFRSFRIFFLNLWEENLMDVWEKAVMMTFKKGSGYPKSFKIFSFIAVFTIVPLIFLSFMVVLFTLGALALSLIFIFGVGFLFLASIGIIFFAIPHYTGELIKYIKNS